MIRIVGLSATLPNYMDVAKFLRVNPFLGLFFFDSRFRPVPLGMTFVGVKTLNRIQRLADMNEVCPQNILSCQSGVGQSMGRLSTIPQINCIGMHLSHCYQ